jgi:acetylornithine deacetylase/succinyl-diaminopimelate desuccinylase-like protein
VHVETKYGAHDLTPLLELIEIPSISGDPRHERDIKRAGAWVADFVSSIEGAQVEIAGDPTSPIVVARIEPDPDRPTVVVYGHYDVQPPGDSAFWLSPPFTPTIAEGWLYGRGAADDKGNFFMLLEAVRSLSAANALPVNVAILSDGEEEISGTAIVAEMNRFQGADRASSSTGRCPCAGSRC